VVTGHDEYGEIDLGWLINTMNTPIIVDGRNIFNQKEAVQKGFTFRGVGISYKKNP
jgi:hypothetical protein